MRRADRMSGAVRPASCEIVRTASESTVASASVSPRLLLRRFTSTTIDRATRAAESTQRSAANTRLRRSCASVSVRLPSAFPPCPLSSGCRSRSDAVEERADNTERDSETATSPRPASAMPETASIAVMTPETWARGARGQQIGSPAKSRRAAHPRCGRLMQLYRRLGRGCGAKGRVLWMSAPIRSDKWRNAPRLSGSAIVQRKSIRTEQDAQGVASPHARDVVVWNGRRGFLRHERIGQRGFERLGRVRTPHEVAADAPRTTRA